jgi:pimeloyl-ACP methyl ester carboxylesterase
MRTVTSKDGATIAFDQYGDGPTLILVTGALGVRSPHPMSRQLSELLSGHFTVIDYDRRGRGDSGDTPPYSVQREVEDLEALIDAAGGSAFLYGLSSGAVLALEAASSLPDKVKKLAMYEPPFIVNDSRPPVPKDYVEQLNTAIAAGRPGDAVEIFMTKALLIPPEFMAQMRNAPMNESFGDDTAVKPPEWADMEKVAHTLAYDGIVMGDTMSGKPLPFKKWFSNNAPTLVITGGNSESFFHDGARALVNDLPRAQHRILEGQGHAVSPVALAPLLIEFFQTEDEVVETKPGS